MLEKTSTPVAPWTVIEANNKFYARIKIMETVIERIDAGVSKTRKKAVKKV